MGHVPSDTHCQSLGAEQLLAQAYLFVFSEIQKYAQMLAHK